jgi:putative ABC transport system permease protein
LRAGADRTAAIAAIGSELPPGVIVASMQSRLGASERLSRAYRVNLNVLALVALFTGGFLVFSAQMLETVRRRAEHALLRVIGLTRSQLMALVLGESAVVGALGALAGAALGYALASLALGYVGGDLGAGQFRGLRPALAPAPVATLGYVALGIVTALAGSLVPALDATRAAPAQALKAGDTEAVFTRVRAPWLGAGLLVAGAGLALLPPVGGIPLFGYLSVAALVFGAVGLMPTFAAALFNRLSVPTTPALTLSAAQLRAAPGQAGVSLAAMLASFSLMVAMAIMVASFRASVDDWLGTVLPADLYFRVATSGDTAWLDAGDAAGLARIDGVERAQFVRSDRLLLDAGRPAVTLLAREIDPAEPDRTLPLVGDPAPLPDGGPTPIWVSEAMVDLYGYRVGAEVDLPLGGRLHRFRVAGIWRDYVRQHGSIVVARDVYVRLTGDARVSEGGLWLAEGTSIEAVRDRIGATPAGARLELTEPGEIRRLSLATFDRTFAVTYVLEAVAILVGLFGLATSLGALVVARRREFGMLRHIGMTRREISTMVAAEGGLVATLGIVAGAAVGGALSLVLIYVINRQSFHWSMDVHVPWAFLVALAGVTLAAATLTAWGASRGATGTAAVRAVREDW